MTHVTFKGIGATALSIGLAAAFAMASVPAKAENYKVAFLAASSENGFNQATWDGIKKRAAKLGNVDVEIFNGEFNATKQYNQVEDIVASKKFQAIIIEPNDTVGIANALKDAIAANIKVVTELFPVGPKLDTLEPQIAGLTATVAANPANGARAQAEGVVKFCEKINPCNTVIMIGQKIYPFDNLRYNTFLETLKPHANIKVVATVEGNYDPDKSMAGLQDVLQAHKDINVILSNADQHVTGALIALKDAGIDPKKLYISGGGASQIMIKNIRDGLATVTLAYFPVSMGEYGLQAAVDALEGKKVNAVIDADKIGGVPALIDKSVLDANPTFMGEWAQ